MTSTIETEPVRDVFDASGRGLQHQGLRRANERAVLTLIAFSPGLSNADISRLSGLAPQTVSAILVDLERAGLLVRGEVVRGRRGQPATPFSLRADGAFAVGVEVSWRHTEVVLLNLHTRVLARQRVRYSYPDALALPGQIEVMIAAVVAELSAEQRPRLLDISLAVPTGLTNLLDLVDAPDEQAALWQGLDLPTVLASSFGVEVTSFNDGSAACWAEFISFPKPRPANFIYFLISRFVAAGIVGEGSLWEGPSRNSANLGSMLVSDTDGRLRPAHFISSLTALEGRLSAAGIDVKDTPMEDWDWDSFGPTLDQWIADSAMVLAKVVFNAGTVIESELVVLDGTLPRDVVARLVEQLQLQLQQLPISGYQPPRVLLGSLGGDAPAVGAAELGLYRRYLSRTIADLAG